jgi:hypothetical protein
MKLFNLDCHVSVIADIKKIYESFGHEVTSWSVSGHNWVFDRDPKQVEIVNQNTWMSLNDEMCEMFYEKYKDELKDYDGFICTYPLSFSMLYEKFNKPIILNIPIRYEVPFHNDKVKWEKFNEYLRNGIDKGIIIPVANSEYDKRYFEFFVKRECDLIPSLCEYTNTQWSPTIDKFLYSTRLPINFNNPSIISKESLGRYKWEDISSYKGIIIIPYNCSTMSIFEYYTSNIPIFCPSKNLMKDLYKDYSDFVLCELTWNKTFNISPGSVIDCDKEDDPNRYDNFDIMSRWIDYSDFYNEEWMPNIIYFDSFESLSDKLNNTNLVEVSNKMKEFNKVRKEKIYDKWSKKLNSINEKFSNR